MERYNSSLLMDVLRARTLRGLKTISHTIQLNDHPLLGKHLLRKSDGKVFVVEKAMRQWWWGWYVSLLIQCDGSHGQAVWWENISCAEDSSQVEWVQKNNADYEMIEK